MYGGGPSSFKQETRSWHEGEPFPTRTLTPASCGPLREEAVLMSSLARSPGGVGGAPDRCTEASACGLGSTCCPLVSPPGLLPAGSAAAPGQTGRPAPSPQSPHTSCVPRREKELQGFPLPPRPTRLRTVEQEAIWEGMGAVRRRQPPEDPFCRRLPPSSASRLNCGVRIDWECKWQLKCNLHSQQEQGGGEGRHRENGRTGHQAPGTDTREKRS